MRDILIIAHFTQVPGELGNGRFQYIAEKIDKKSTIVEVVTSSFSHKTKKQRRVYEEQLTSIGYKITMLNEPGYSKNVSLKRFFSHYMFGRNLKKYLETRKKPDVIYCSVPSLDAAKVVTVYAKKENIRIILDIQDLWPEAYKMVLNVPIISDIIFYPMKKKADYIYSAADEVVAVSETYASRAMRVNDKCKMSRNIFLGTELATFDKLVEKNSKIIKPEDEIWIVYIGTLGHSYDLTCVMDALKKLDSLGPKHIKFLVMGDGPLKNKFEAYAQELNLYVEFTGRLDYGEMVRYLSKCDIAVNPITRGAAQSIINKVGDYAAAGLPVLNTQECLEYRNLVEQYNMGINCNNSDSEDLARGIKLLYENESLRREYSKNSRKLAEDKFDRAKTYSDIFSLLE